MANLNFKDDLKLGNSCEKVVSDFLTSKGAQLLNDNDDSTYDISMMVNGKKVTYEIKTDFKCAPSFDTGNLFIEYRSRNKDSGIAVTCADWFVTYFIYLNELWFIKSSNLKILIEDNNFEIFKNAGDLGSETHGYLINREKYKKYFKIYKTIFI